MHDTDEMLHDPEALFTMFVDLIASEEDEEVNLLQVSSLQAMEEFYKTVKEQNLSEKETIKQLATMLTATILSVKHRAFIEVEKTH